MSPRKILVAERGRIFLSAFSQKEKEREPLHLIIPAYLHLQNKRTTNSLFGRRGSLDRTRMKLITDAVGVAAR